MTLQELLQLCHDQAHDAEHNVEDAMLVSLTRQETWLVTFALILVDLNVDCLTHGSVELRTRLAELVDTQKPHWRQPESGGETS